MFIPKQTEMTAYYANGRVVDQLNRDFGASEPALSSIFEDEIVGETREALYKSIPQKLSNWKPNPYFKFTAAKLTFGGLFLFPTCFLFLLATVYGAVGSGTIAAGIGLSGVALLGFIIAGFTLTHIFQRRFMTTKLSEEEIADVKNKWQEHITDKMRVIGEMLMYRNYGRAGPQGWQFTQGELHQIQSLRILNRFASLGLMVEITDLPGIKAARETLDGKTQDNF